MEGRRTNVSRLRDLLVADDAQRVHLESGRAVRLVPPRLEPLGASRLRQAEARGAEGLGRISVIRRNPSAENAMGFFRTEFSF